MRPYVTTHCDPKLLEESDSNERIKFLITNHKKAIALLRTIKPYQHDQGTYARKEEANVCGTAACGLGWVAIVGVVDGLQYTIDTEGKRGNKNEYYAIVNGKTVPWWEAGRQFFGSRTQDRVFSNGGLNMQELLGGLRERLSDLKNQLKYGQMNRLIE